MLGWEPGILTRNIADMDLLNEASQIALKVGIVFEIGIMHFIFL